MLTKVSKCKRGFTLIELMVYIGLLGVVVVIAGIAFSDSTKFRLRSEGMIKANATASDVASFMLEDVGQTGAKVAKYATATSLDGFESKDSLYLDPDNASAVAKDSSSYRISKSCTNCNTDTLTVRRVRYNDAGEFVAVEEVRWFTVGRKLFRGCRTINNTSSTADADCPVKDRVADIIPVEIADNVDTFKVVPAKPRVISDGTNSANDKSYLLPGTSASVKNFRLVPRYGEGDFMPVTVSPAAGGINVTLSNFATNYDFELMQPIVDGKKANQVFVAEASGANSSNNSWKDLCLKVDLEPHVEYEIAFSAPYDMNPSRMFCPGRDYAAVGFRTADGAKVAGLDDFNFFMPASATEKPTRSIRFNVKQQVNDVCMAFTFASYSPLAANGKISLQDVALRKVETSNFNFDDEDYVPLISDKMNVKALMLKLVVKYNGESSIVKQIIPIPSNGPRD